MSIITLQNGDFAVHTTVYLPFELREKARELEINISQACRNAISNEIIRKSRRKHSDE